jgi:hypothetical protein
METRRLPWGFAGSSVRFAAAALADSAAGVAFCGVTIVSIFAVEERAPGSLVAENLIHSFLEQRERADNLQGEFC